VKNGPLGLFRGTAQHRPEGSCDFYTGGHWLEVLDELLQLQFQPLQFLCFRRCRVLQRLGLCDSSATLIQQALHNGVVGHEHACKSVRFGSPLA